MSCTLCLFVVFVILLAGCNVANAQETSLLRTPKTPVTPRINGPKLYGARMGHPFLYRIPCTGARPIRFTARDLPSSLQLDPVSGIISGSAPVTHGEYVVMLTAKNVEGQQSRAFKIVVGDHLSLTPQMGWNDWYTAFGNVTDLQVRQAADVMIRSGMADYGYQFIDIDDAWSTKPGSKDPDFDGPPRDASGAILPNRRFPDMKALTDYVHSKGLRAGIYTSPGEITCGTFEGSYQYEKGDANRFSDWGFDLLKYDYCYYGRVSAGKTLADLQKPYYKMGDILKNLDRDIVFNICQYGMGDVWNWGRDAGGNSWRTTGDLGLQKATTLPGFYSIGFANAVHDQYAGPGGWNDPDYILIGKMGNPNHPKDPPTPTHLTPDEQYSYMSMWSLMASPLFFSGDMGTLDAFTLNVLCNSEVIDIDQDPLGKQGRIVRKTQQEFVLAKPLEDGSLAVGLFNLSETPHTISISLGDLGLTGRQTVRDVWRQHNMTTSAKTFATEVPRHGVILVRLIPKHSK
jgi:alpha-galactosidase